MINKIKAYFTGHIRYSIYYSRFQYLIRKHIKEQIDWRIIVMEQECYDQGSCQICGCTTTALQMANKSCDKPCYPPLMSKRDFEVFQNEKPVTIGYFTWGMKVVGDVVKIYKDSELVHIKDCK